MIIHLNIEDINTEYTRQELACFIYDMLTTRTSNQYHHTDPLFNELEIKSVDIVHEDGAQLFTEVTSRLG